MEWITAFRNSKTALSLAKMISDMAPPPMRLMEVCGTHTVAIAHNGIRELMPEAISLTSGPGCPVCVTSIGEINCFIAASRMKGTIITTFGDLMKVPGSSSSLIQEKSQGADIRIVYSALDAVEIARQNPNREVVFLGVGFETTTPTIAAAILQAQQENLKNFSVISAHKLMPPALESLISDPEVKIDGLLCPGHVSIMIGAKAFEPLAKQYKIPCVIAGFEAADILHAIVMLAQQIKKNETPTVEISYQRAVYEKGNKQAMDIMNKVFEPVDTQWRGIGKIPDSGLRIRQEFKQFDTDEKFALEYETDTGTKGCQCGEVLRGIILPPECRLFKEVCSPERPIGPCMVSSEGACAAYYRYGR